MCVFLTLIVVTVGYDTDNLSGHPEVTISYFKPDERKAGGAYIEATGTVKKIDDYEWLVTMTDGAKLPMSDILDIIFHQ